MRGTFWRTTADLLRGKPIIQGNDLEEVRALKDVTLEIRREEFAPNYGIMKTMTSVDIREPDQE